MRVRVQCQQPRHGCVIPLNGYVLSWFDAVEHPGASDGCGLSDQASGQQALTCSQRVGQQLTQQHRLNHDVHGHTAAWQQRKPGASGQVIQRFATPGLQHPRQASRAPVIAQAVPAQHFSAFAAEQANMALPLQHRVQPFCSALADGQ